MRLASLLDNAMVFLVYTFALALLTSRAGINTAVITSGLLFIIIFLKQPFYIRTVSAVQKAIAGFFLTMLFLCMFSQDIAASFKGVAYWLYAFLPFYCTLYALRKQNVADKASILIALSAFVGASVTIWQGMHGMIRARGLLGIMDLAGILGLVIPFLLVQTFEFPTRSKYVQWLFGISFLLAVFALLYNGTRGVWISTALTIGAYVIFNILKDKRLLRGSVICGLIFIAFLATHPTIIQRAATVLDTDINASNIQRIQMWQYAWNTFSQHPIAGVGFKTLHSISFTPDNKLILEDYSHVGGGHVHNTFLQLLAESGIIGFSAFSGLFGMVLYVAWRKANEVASRRWGWITLLCTSHLLIHGLFDYTFSASTELHAYWFIMGLAFANLGPITLYQIGTQGITRTDM